MSASDPVLSVPVIQTVEDDPTESVLSFLDALDPATIERVALDRLGWGDSDCLTATVIQVMREIASGAAVS